MTRDAQTPSGKIKKWAVVGIPLLVVGAYFGYLWFVSGVLPSREFYPNGEKKALGYVRRHGFAAYRRTGHWVTFHRNGRKASEGFYENGKKVGAWSYWDERGEPLSGEPPEPRRNPSERPSVRSVNDRAP